jgi:hypothetical protein
MSMVGGRWRKVRGVPGRDERLRAIKRIESYMESVRVQHDREFDEEIERRLQAPDRPSTARAQS